MPLIDNSSMSFDRTNLERLIEESEDGNRRDGSRILHPWEVVDALPQGVTDTLLTELREPCLWTIRGGRLVIGDGTDQVPKETRAIVPRQIAKIHAALFVDEQGGQRSLGTWGVDVEKDWGIYKGDTEAAVPGTSETTLDSTPKEVRWFVDSDLGTVQTYARNGWSFESRGPLLVERDIPTVVEYKAANETGRFDRWSPFLALGPIDNFSTYVWPDQGRYNLWRAHFSRGRVEFDDKMHWIRNGIYADSIARGSENDGARTVLRINLVRN